MHRPMQVRKVCGSGWTKCEGETKWKCLVTIMYVSAKLCVISMCMGVSESDIKGKPVRVATICEYLLQFWRWILWAEVG